jgi:hypothetical protein
MLYRNNMRTPVLSILYPQTANLDSKTEDLGTNENLAFV